MNSMKHGMLTRTGTHRFDGLTNAIGFSWTNKLALSSGIEDNYWGSEKRTHKS